MTSRAGGISGQILDTYLSLRFELQKHLRRRRLLIVVALAILMPLVFYIIPRAADADFAASASGFATIVFAFVSVLIVISAALFAGDTVSGEFEGKTGLLLFPTTQSRLSIFIGKYVAALLATVLVVTLYCGVTVIEMVAVYGAGEIPAGMAQSYALALLYSASVVSVVFFLSSVLKRTISSTILGFVLMIMVLPILQNVISLVDVEPWFVLTYSAGLMMDALGSIAGGFGGPGGGFASAAFTRDLSTGIAVMIAYALVFLVGGMFAANRRSLE